MENQEGGNLLRSHDSSNEENQPKVKAIRSGGMKVNVFLTREIQSKRQMGRYYFQQGEYQSALINYKAILDKMVDPVDITIEQDCYQCDILLDISDTLREQYHYDDAQEYCIQAEKIAKKVKDKLRLAKCYDNHGKLNTIRNHYQQALEDFNQALEFKLSLLDDRNLHVSDTYHSIATVLYLVDENSQALVMYQKSLNIRLNLLGDENLYVAYSYHGIANIYRKQHQYDDALTMYQKSLLIQLAILGYNHVSLVGIYNAIATLHCSPSKCNNAVKIYQKSLDMKLEIFNKYHLDIADTYHGIGNVNYLQSRYDDALKLYQMALDIRLKLVGNCNLYIAQSYYAMGNIYYYQDKIEEAQEMHEKSFNIRLALLSDNHLLVAQSYYMLGQIYLSLANYSDALSYHQKCLNIRLKVLDDENLLVAHSYHAIASIYHKQSDYDTALTMYKKSVQIKLQLFGNNYDVAYTYDSISSLYLDLGQHYDALSWCQKSLTIGLTLFGENNPFIANLYDKIATICERQEKFSEAATAHQISSNDNNDIPLEKFNRILNEDQADGNIDSSDLEYSWAIPSTPKTPIKEISIDEFIDLYQKNGNSSKRDKVMMDALSDSIEEKEVQETNDKNNNSTRSRSDSRVLLKVTEESIEKMIEELSDPEDAQEKVLSITGGMLYKSDYDDENVRQCQFGARTILDFTEDLNEGTIQNWRDIGGSIDCFQDSLRTTLKTIIESSEGEDNDLSEMQEQSVNVDTENHANGKKEGVTEDNFLSNLFKIVIDSKRRNDFVRLMFIGLSNAGKSSVIRILTQNGIIENLQSTKIINTNNEVVNLIHDDSSTNPWICDFIKVLNQKLATSIDSVKRELIKNLPAAHDGNGVDAKNNNNSSITNDHGENKHLSGTEKKAEIVKDPYLVIDREKKEVIQMVVDHQQEDQIETRHVAHNSTTLLVNSSSEETTLSTHISNQYQALGKLAVNKYFRSILEALEATVQVNHDRYGSLWEFCGQTMYRCLHYPFIPGRGIYILVLNVTSDLSNTQDDQSANIADLEGLHEWLTLIIGSSDNREQIKMTVDGIDEEYSWPVIVLVASYIDSAREQYQLEQRFKQVEQQLISSLPPLYRCHIYSSGILFNCNPNDNSQATVSQRLQSSRNLLHIVGKITDILPFMNDLIPIRWYMMTILLQPKPFTNKENNTMFPNGMKQNISNPVSNIMTMQQMQQFAIDHGLYKDDQDLHDMLMYLHDFGKILYCYHKVDDRIIVTNINWLLNILYTISALEEHQFHSAAIRHDYQVARTTGKMSELCLNYAIKRFHLGSNEKEIILRLMAYYHIACQIKSNRIDHQNEERQFFVPYILQTNTNELELTGYHRSNWLYIGFDRNDMNCIPDAIFYCLLVSCLNQWNNPQIKVFNQCAQYSLQDEDYEIIVRKERSYIGLQYCYQIIEDKDLADLVLNNIKLSISDKRPHDMIREQLSEIVAKRMSKFKKASCQYYVKCPKCLLPTCTARCYQNNPCVIRCQCNQVFKSKSVEEWMMGKSIDLCMEKDLNSKEGPTESLSSIPVKTAEKLRRSVSIRARRYCDVQ
ncbi:uncharacterized protein TRIADDRAFT_54078 [Trichoplax adhaerens]|uniref:Nephrocystin-3 n=1 Tax=Trichoplax adhaerens TaxID=10228 RepID=B3RR18_TRIAD|nr:hypothetical protein TRIADDRAFT_54078 [Trichoplax adhaerens]EDV26803.1 hypothetical protein TRIADDRAFT_54078 [Trichoplax adhaerens]|eukprot:XP_002110799.1 hypothetical protein TRIADDRAFT_54078 [Trichoplax adhaerens]